MDSNDKKKFDELGSGKTQSDFMNFNDDLIFIMITHILTIGIAVSSGYHDNHFAVGECLFFSNLRNGLRLLPLNLICCAGYS